MNSRCELTILMPCLNEENTIQTCIEKGAMPFLHRYIGTPAISFVGRLIYKNNIGDYNCGLRGFRRQSIIDIFLKSYGMEYASEMIVKASINNLSMCEVPVNLYKDGRNGKSHLRTFRDGIRHMKILIFHYFFK